MAMPTVYENVAPDANVRGQLFTGKKFWVAQRVPQRNSYLERIRSNGGEVVMLEKKADYLIADHFRKDCPPGSISYTFIEESMKNGALADPEDHRAGPPLGTAREAGSIRPAKMGRVAYTTEDDAILYNWVKPYEDQGGAYKGNEIYKQLEAKHPQHTWQSYRDRYLKKVRHRKPAVLTVPHNAPPSPPSDQSAHHPQTARQPSGDADTRRRKLKIPAGFNNEGLQGVGEKRAKSEELYTVEELWEMFDEEEWEELYANAQHILDVNVKEYLQGWEDWSKGNNHTAEQWKQFFEKVVLPEWEEDTTPRKKAVEAKVWERHANDNEGDGEKPNAGCSEPSNSTPSRKRKAQEADLRESSPEAGLFDSFVDRFLKERQGRRAQEAYMFWARERNGHRKIALWEEDPGLSPAELHKRLKPQWDALPDADKVIYAIMEDADKRRVEIEQERSLKRARIGKKKVEGEQEQLLSSSTEIQKTPDYVARTYTRIMHRIESGELEKFSPQNTATHQSKRAKRGNSSPVEPREEQVVGGTQQSTLEISSRDESSEPEDEEEMVDAVEVQQIEDKKMAPVIEDNEELNEEDGTEDDSSGGEDLPGPSILDRVDPVSTSDLPSYTPPSRTQRTPRPNTTEFDAQVMLSSHSRPILPPPTSSSSVASSPSPVIPLQALPFPRDTPTPRARRTPRPNVTAFDTQATLSPESPIIPLQPLPPPQDTPTPRTRRTPRSHATAFNTQAILRSSSPIIPLQALPRPQETQLDQNYERETSARFSSPLGQTASVSTTHSIQEFRRSLQETEETPLVPENPVLAPLPRPEESASSQASEAASTDPDPMLEPDEVDEFWAEQKVCGFTDDEIAAALHWTMFRPVLASEVLDAWAQGNDPPNKRGIWSEEEDKAAEGGDGLALALLQRKHSMDGWGGLEERMKYLSRRRDVS